MKKIFLLIITTIVLAACSAPTIAKVQSNPKSNLSNNITVQTKNAYITKFTDSFSLEEMTILIIDLEFVNNGASNELIGQYYLTSYIDDELTQPSLQSTDYQNTINTNLKPEDNDYFNLLPAAYNLSYEEGSNKYRASIVLPITNRYHTLILEFFDLAGNSIGKLYADISDVEVIKTEETVTKSTDDTDNNDDTNSSDSNNTTSP